MVAYNPDVAEKIEADADCQELGDAVYACHPSFAQQRLWFLNQLDPDSSAYNLSLTFRVRGRLDTAALEYALNALVQRHEVLRTTFETFSGELMQIIAPSFTVALPITDVQAVPAEQRESVAESLLTEEVKRPFDLRNGPIFRAHLWRLAPEDGILMLNMHHIAGDGWSFGILRREIGAHYESYRTGRPAHLPDLPVQYADFASWQREWLHGDALEQQFAYWHERLGEQAPVLNMPTDFPRPSVRTSQGAVQRILIPAAVCAGIKSLSERHGCTTYMTYLAAYKVLLHRFSGQTDLWVGSPVAGRTHQETESLIGCFVNTLVLRTECAGQPSFLDFLHQVRDVSIGALAHQEMPFEMLVDKLDTERDRSRNPLFQAMFIDSSTFIQPLELPEVTFAPLLIERGGAMLDLTLFLVGSPDGLKVGLEYSTDLFEHTTATRFLQTYVTLLESIVSDPAQTIDRLNLLTDAERKQILVDWNATQTDYPHAQALPHYLQTQAAATPDATALVFGGQTLTYDALNRQANQLAHRLRSLGVRPDVPVGICLPRSPQMLVTLLAILKAGGAYVPLDPALPAERLALMQTDAQMPLIVTLSEFAPLLSGSDARLLCLDTEQETIAAQSQDNPPPLATAESLAYLLYTSGSTGKPKGVAVSHRALLNLLFSMQQTPGLSPHDTLAAVTTLSFDIAGLELWLPLLTGAKIVLVDETTRTDGQRLAQLLEQEAVTVMQATPATWRLLMEAGWQGKSDLKVLCGGEALPLELARQLKPRCGSLWNMYGPTETTIWSTLAKITGEEDRITIGRPIANTQVYLLDTNLQPVPVGVAGELHIGGDGLAQGYWNLPDLTSEKFIRAGGGVRVSGVEKAAAVTSAAVPSLASVSDPRTPPPDTRLYKTGDLARYRADGTIEYLGRLDFQVKIRGFRIEIGDIEAALSRHPGIAACVVVAQQDEFSEERLIAYLVPTAPQKIETAEIRAYLQERLPHYMIPSTFVALDALPLNSSGKVNRKALPAPALTRSESETHENDAPCDALQAQLQTIWESVLHVPHIGIRDNFFDLGGHSLVAVQMFAAIERETGKKLPLALLFQAPTIAQLAEHLRQPETETDWSPLVAIQPKGTLPPFFCVHAVGANVLNYRLLSQHMGENQPFYGFQAQGLDGKQTPLGTVQEMAAQYIHEMRKVRPHGPYVLGGGSSGGTVAFEMAQQLTAQGEEVAFVALIDTVLMRQQMPTRLPSVSALQAQVRLLDLHIGKMLHLTFRDQLRYLASAIRSKSAAKLGTRAGGKADNGKDAPTHETFMGLRKTILEAIRQYQPAPYAGRVALFLAEKSPYRTHNDPRLRWSEFADAGLELHVIPGDHDSILDEPHVAALAVRLRTCIERTVS